MEIKEFLMRIFRAVVLSLFISLAIGDILYINLRMNPDYDASEWIKIEYFEFLYFMLIGTILFLTPFPSVKNYKLSFLLRITKSFCLAASLILPYYYYIFTVKEAYGSYLSGNEFMETRKALSIIFASLLFAAFFHWENKKMA